MFKQFASSRSRPRFVQLAPALAACALLVILSLPCPAQAQEVQRIAAIVNDEPVSDYDLEQRMRLVLSTGDVKVTTEEELAQVRQEILQTLVNERLQIQEALANDITVSEQQVDEALKEIADRNKLTVDELASMLASADIDIKTLRDQLRAQLAWRELIGTRILPRVGVGEEDVTAAYEQLRQNAALPERLVAEILLAVNSPEQEQEVQRTALELVEQLRNGTPFPVVAREHSDAATAAVGGDLGWVLRGQLAEEVDDALDVMAKGAISEPIRTSGGYVIVMLRDRREPLSEDATISRLTLQQVVLPVAKNAAPEAVQATIARARALKDRIRDCAELADAPEAKESFLSGPLGTVRVQDLPTAFQAPLADLGEGQATEPFRTDDGIHLVMVCGREEQQQIPTRDMVEERLEQAKLDILARRYLRDIRRDALVEYR